MVADFCAGAPTWLCAGLIIALACAAGIFVVSMMICCCCLCKKHKNSEKDQESNPTSSDQHKEKKSCCWCCMKKKHQPADQQQTQNTNNEPKEKKHCCSCLCCLMCCKKKEKHHHEHEKKEHEKKERSCCMCCKRKKHHKETTPVVEQSQPQPSPIQIGYAPQKPCGPCAVNGPAVERGWMWPLLDQGWTPQTNNGWMMLNAPNNNPPQVSGYETRLVLNNAATRPTSCYQPCSAMQSNFPSYQPQTMCNSAPNLSTAAPSQSQQFAWRATQLN